MRTRRGRIGAHRERDRATRTGDAHVVSLRLHADAGEVVGVHGERGAMQTFAGLLNDVPVTMPQPGALLQL